MDPAWFKDRDQRRAAAEDALTAGPPALSDTRQRRLALEAELLAKLRAQHLAKAKTTTEWLADNPLTGPEDPDANAPHVPAPAAARAPTATLRARSAPGLRARSVPGGSSNDPFRHFQVSGVRPPGCPGGWNPEAFGVPRGAGLTHRDAIGYTDAYRVPALIKTVLCSFYKDGACRRGRQQHKQQQQQQTQQLGNTVA